jgi:hypothetical protein
MGLEGMIEDVLKQCTPSQPPSDGAGDWQHSDFWEGTKKWKNKLPLWRKKRY